MPETISAPIRAAIAEFEAGETIEAVCARDADKLECLLQAREYQVAGATDIEAWIESSKRAVKTETGRRLAEEALVTHPGDWWEGRAGHPLAREQLGPGVQQGKSFVGAWVLQREQAAADTCRRARFEGRSVLCCAEHRDRQVSSSGVGGLAPERGHAFGHLVDVPEQVVLGKPLVAEVEHPLLGLGGVAAQQDRRVRALDGLGPGPQRIEVDELAVVLGLVLRPDRLHRAHSVVEQPHPGARVGLVVGQLRAVPASADAEQEAAVPRRDRGWRPSWPR